MSDTQWYTQVFGEHYLRAYARRLTAERTRQEVDGIIALLEFAPGSSILDLCCGQGRHAIPLAEQGYRVTGLDLSEFLLQQAREEATGRSVEVQWLRGDMRDIPYRDSFDGVINLFTSFGYFETEAEDRKMLHEVYKALKPGGRFLIQVVNRENALRRFDPHTIERHDDGLLVLAERRFDLFTSRAESHDTILYPDGRRFEWVHSVRLYTLTELARMVEDSGLRVRRYYGEFDGSALALDSVRMLLLAEKTA